MTENVVHRVVDDDIEAALQRVERGESIAEDANLLRAILDGFESLVRVLGVEIELISEINKSGRSCFYLMMTYPPELD